MLLNKVYKLLVYVGDRWCKMCQNREDWFKLCEKQRESVKDPAET